MINFARNEKTEAMGCVKMLILDVDGTLTDGKIYMSDHGELFKAFNIKDGYALSTMLPEAGIVPVIMTSRQSKIVELRCRELGVKYCYQGVRDKAEKLREIAEKFGLNPDADSVYQEIAYIGDDLVDLPAMNICGVVGCPADAAKEVKAVADYICLRKAGEGATREFAEEVIRLRRA